MSEQICDNCDEACEGEYPDPPCPECFICPNCGRYWSEDGEVFERGEKK